MAVKCLNKNQKTYIIYYFHKKQMTNKQLADQFSVSPRTINRVLVEAGLATTISRIKGEAYHVMKLLEKHGLDLRSLTKMLEKETIAA